MRAGPEGAIDTPDENRNSGANSIGSAPHDTETGRATTGDMSAWDAETAEWYARKYGEYATNRLAVDALDLAPGCTVVDVGCGTGAALRRAAAVVTEGHLIGVDPVPRMLEIARERTAAHPGGTRIEFREGAAEALPVEDAVADVVLAFDSFDHWRDPGGGLGEVRRVLRPYGRLVVVKDGSVPGGGAARRAFVEAATASGFRVIVERRIEDEGVSFTMWTCVGSA